jgi:S-DNA-T family DNA segregation ATPase FtsK/SpoIIIE
MDILGRTWSWPRSERARRRDRERANAELINQLRWKWRNACMSTSLTSSIYTSSGSARAVPVIDRVDLGPPVSFSVKLRPGQTLDAFIAAAPSIASGMDAATMEVTQLVPQWVQVVLVPAPAVAAPATPSDPSVRRESRSRPHQT